MNNFSSKSLTEIKILLIDFNKNNKQQEILQNETLNTTKTIINNHHFMSLVTIFSKKEFTEKRKSKIP